MQIISWKNIPRDDKQGYSKRILATKEDIWSPSNLLQEIKIKPGETAAAHIHKIQTEVFYIVTENGYRIVNGKKVTPKIWDVLIIKPNDSHAVVNESDVDYMYLSFKVNYVEDDLYRDKE